MANDESAKIREELERLVPGRRVLRVAENKGYARVWLDGPGSPRLGLTDQQPEIAEVEDQTIRTARIMASGALQLDLTNGAVVTCEPKPAHESWELHDEVMIRLLCLPGGEVVRWVPLRWWERLADRILTRLQRN